MPLYGDVFGQRRDALDSDDEVDKVSRWGELEVVEEESSEEEEEEELEGGYPFLYAPSPPRISVRVPRRI